MTAVLSVTREFPMPSEAGPLGVTITGWPEPWRLRCGSGIAGRGGSWSLVRVRGNERFGDPVTSKAKLRVLLREWLATESVGQKPGPGWYAKMHETSIGGQNYVWCRKSFRANRA